MKLPSALLTLLLVPGLVHQASAAKYTLNNPENSVIGQIQTIRSERADTLLDIARSHGLGYQDIKLTNPHLDTWIPGADKEVTLPLSFILPNTVRRGIVLNIPEMRLYYYPQTKLNVPLEVYTYPLGVGRQGWSTPFIKTKIIEKKEKPKWHPPESIRAEHEEAGDPLPKVVEAGPDNPLGDYAMRLGLPDYLIHGTNKPFGIGMRVSHGCIRLYPEDIESLFQRVKLGTPVEIVNQPYKIGVLDGVLYLEAHPYLEEDAAHYENNLTPVVKLIVSSTKPDEFDIDWDKVRETVRNPNGVPAAIGVQRLAKMAEADLTILPRVEEQVSKSDAMSVDSVLELAREKQESKLKLRLDSNIKPVKYKRTSQ